MGSVKVTEEQPVQKKAPINMNRINRVMLLEFIE